MKNALKKLIVIDARMVGPHGHGIAKYVEGIAARLRSGDPVVALFQECLGMYEIGQLEFEFIIRSDCPEDSPIRQFKTHIYERSVFDPRSWWGIPALLKSKKADLFFNPSFSSQFALPCPFLQTVHDLNHLHFGTFLQKAYYHVLLKPSLLRAQIICTVSETMRVEIAQFLKISESKIRVHFNSFFAPYHFNDEELGSLLKPLSLTAGKYHLSVTNLKEHKNVPFLLAAHKCAMSEVDLHSPVSEPVRAWSEAFRSVGADLPLVLTTPEFLPAANPNVKFVGGVSDLTLLALYQGCRAFFFPSLYEGFGRPPVEAAYANVKNIFVSDIPVHHEAMKSSPQEFHFLPIENREKN